jgi:hypothetical protein
VLDEVQELCPADNTKAASRHLYRNVVVTHSRGLGVGVVLGSHSTNFDIRLRGCASNRLFGYRAGESKQLKACFPFSDVEWNLYTKVKDPNAGQRRFLAMSGGASCLVEPRQPLSFTAGLMDEATIEMALKARQRAIDALMEQSSGRFVLVSVALCAIAYILKLFRRRHGCRENAFVQERL